MRLAATCRPNPVRQGRRCRVAVTRPVWRQDISDAERQVASVGDFYLEVHLLPISRRWGWHIWNGPSVSSVSVYGGREHLILRRFRFLAVRDALREVSKLRGVTP